MKWVQNGPDWELRKGRTLMASCAWRKDGSWRVLDEDMMVLRAFKHLASAKRFAEKLAALSLSA